MDSLKGDGNDGPMDGTAHGEHWVWVRQNTPYPLIIYMGAGVWRLIVVSPEDTILFWWSQTGVSNTWDTEQEDVEIESK